LYTSTTEGIFLQVMAAGLKTGSKDIGRIGRLCIGIGRKGNKVQYLGC
jgi:hypothetical protein